MENWEHCISLLKAGAPPTQVLPNLRALFERLHSSIDGDAQGAASNAGEFGSSQIATSSEDNGDGSSRHPTSTLWHRLDNSYPLFPVPYVKPAPHVWQVLRDADSRLPPHSSFFDSELDFDILSGFKVRLISPPEHSMLRRMLDEEPLWRSVPAEFLSHFHAPEQTNLSSLHRASERAGVDRANSKTDKCPLSEEQLDAIGRTFVKYLDAISSSPESSPSCPSFSLLSADEWAWVLCNSFPDTGFTPQVIEKLLQSVLQPPFAHVILKSFLPQLACELNIDDFSRIIDLAVDAADVTHMNHAEVHELLNVYQSLEDVPGGVARTSIAKRISVTGL